MGLDYGRKRIGVAQSDELKFMAHAVGFVSNRDNNDAIEAIKKLATKCSAEKIVVGFPATMKGEVGIQGKVVLKFVELLSQAVSCEVVTWDERLTTAEAEKILLAHDISRAKRKLRRDAIAAEIMLQSYIDYLKGRKDVDNV